MTLHAITVRTPFSRCIAAGAKNVENRGQQTHHRGLVAIHEGKAADHAAYADPRVVQALGPNADGDPLGAVLAVAELVDCHQANECCQPWGDRFYGTQGKPAWHLVLDNIRALDRPVHCRGHLRVGWVLPGDVEAAVREQLTNPTETAPRT